MSASAVLAEDNDEASNVQFDGRRAPQEKFN
jgi:hypothetical protein